MNDQNGGYVMEGKEKKLPDLFPKETTRRGFLRGTAVAAGSAVAMVTVGGLAAKAAHAQAAAACATEERLDEVSVCREGELHRLQGL